MLNPIRFLDVELIERIVAEALSVLAEVGVEMNDPEARRLLREQSCQVDEESKRVFLPPGLVRRALETAPDEFKLYDSHGESPLTVGGEHVHFAPGSSAVWFLEAGEERPRRPETADYVRYARLTATLPGLAAQSTAFIPADVPEAISDAYRLYLSLLFCKKPIVTGAFTGDSFALMHDLLLAVRGSEAALRQKPLAAFTCCPLSPLRYSESALRNLMDCARAGIPVEIVAMPLAGFTAPVTTVGLLVTHAAEVLAGVTLHQLTAPGAPLLFGGSPTIFDMRHQTTPMGAIEALRFACCYSEIGRHLGLPTQAYLGFSDAKAVDAQAGLEAGMGAMVAAAAGINSIDGPGLLAFQNCFSLEALVLHHEAAAAVLALRQRVQPGADLPTLDLVRELVAKRHLVAAEHTRTHWRSAQRRPSPLIDRSAPAAESADADTLGERATAEVGARIATTPSEPLLPESTVQDLRARLYTEAKRHGLRALPSLPA